MRAEAADVRGHGFDPAGRLHALDERAVQEGRLLGGVDTDRVLGHGVADLGHPDAGARGVQPGQLVLDLPAGHPLQGLEETVAGHAAAGSRRHPLQAIRLQVGVLLGGGSQLLGRLIRATVVGHRVVGDQHPATVAVRVVQVGVGVPVLADDGGRGKHLARAQMPRVAGRGHHVRAAQRGGQQLRRGGRAARTGPAGGAAEHDDRTIEAPPPTGVRAETGGHLGWGGRLAVKQEPAVFVEVNGQHPSASKDRHRRGQRGQHGRVLLRPGVVVAPPPGQRPRPRPSRGNRHRGNRRVLRQLPARPGAPGQFRQSSRDASGDQDLPLLVVKFVDDFPHLCRKRVQALVPCFPRLVHDSSDRIEQRPGAVPTWEHIAGDSARCRPALLG